MFPELTRLGRATPFPRLWATKALRSGCSLRLAAVGEHSASFGAGLDISVVLPVFNEVGHLAYEIDRVRKNLEASDYSFELIVVDDGSTDGSSEALVALEGIRLLSLPMNQGVGVARKWGTMVARGEVVVWTDVDMTYPNDQIPWLVEQLAGVDHVIGSRRDEMRIQSPLRRAAKWMIRKLAGVLAGKPIEDLNSGFRAFRREVADQFLHILPKGFSCVTTLTMAFLSNGYSVKYVPVEYLPRAGISKFHWWTDTRRYVLQVIRMTLMWEPLRVFGPPAVVAGVLGLGKLGFDVIAHDWRVAADTLLLLGIALSLLVLGMIADLFVQLHKQRTEVLPVLSPPSPRELAND